MTYGAFYLNQCIACGRVEVGHRRSILPDGPPLSLCTTHEDLIDGDGVYGIYCMSCARMTFVLRSPDYDGDKLVFADVCPCCDSTVTKIEAKSWTNHTTNAGSSTPSDGANSPDGA